MADYGDSTTANSSSIRSPDVSPALPQLRINVGNLNDLAQKCGNLWQTAGPKESHLNTKKNVTDTQSSTFDSHETTTSLNDTLFPSKFNMQLDALNLN